MPNIRAFIAVQLPPEVKQALSCVQDTLKSGPGAPVKWVEPQNLHLTLKFLGDIDPDSVGSILAAMKEAAAGTGNLHLEMSGLGTFPGGRRVRIVWAGLAGEIKKLADLQERIETRLVPIGFQKEPRGFQPHLTIGRVRDQASPSEREDLYRRIERETNAKKARVSIDSVFLMQSRLTPSGPIYSELGHVFLSSG